MQTILNKVTYHAVYDESILNALTFAKANGFAGVQVAVETPHLSFSKTDRAERARIRAFLVANGLILSLHGPDDTASLFVCDPQLRAGIFGYFAALFRFAEEVGAALITLHTGTIATFPTDGEPARRMPPQDETSYVRALSENLRRLIDLAAGRFLLCIENYRMDEIVLDSIAPHIANGTLSLCWDIAKTYDVRGNLITVMDAYFHESIAHVRQVHLHDIRAGRSHAVVGTGVIDFMRFLVPLADAQVLEYCIEVRPREKALESLHNLATIARAK